MTARARHGVHWAGDPARPTLVFLHEGLGSVSRWRDFPARLCAAAGCPGFAYDREGHGLSPALRSPREPDYLARAATEELPAVLARELPGRAYVLVGHSDGGTIALEHAATCPPLLRGVVTEAAHVFVEDVTLEGIRAAVRARAEGRLEGLARHHGGKADALFAAWSLTWLDPGFATWNIEAALATIAVPVLAIQGRDDAYGTPAQLEAIARGSGGPVRTVLLDGCAHAPHAEAAEAVLRLVAEFVAPLVAPPGA